MLRDFKLPRRNPGKHEETENVDPVDSSAATQRCTEASRPPLNTIQEADASYGSKIERTPSKTNKSRGGHELRTPDKHGGSLQWKHRFGWPQRNDAVSSVCDDRRGSGVGNATPRATRTAGRVASSGAACSESYSTQSTPTKSVTKPPPSSSVRSKADGSFSARLGNYAALYKGIPSSGCTTTVVNTVEVPHFDLKEDSSFLIMLYVQAAEIAKPLSEVNPSIAEEALEKLKNRITSLEMEQEDLKFKNKIINERIRLSELTPQASPLNSRLEENRTTPPSSISVQF